ncbi:ATP-binding protein [Vibrio hepatarius]|uniref:ATP-binding protein n=1 Tax=Vibrio hepatarius TaxID=171383 RepID=UPI00142D5D23|nr:ATP-binding protein [Vibrio hepatarius]NIY83190.1 ATP-binding protein [Vibrio hepatarius]NVJ58524.1 ATP-binding protein [Vibrionaceae bacterium]
MTLKLTLIRGLPGSGKSTLAKTFHANHYEADMYFVDNKGCYAYQAEKLALAHQWCQSMTEKSLARKQSVVVSNTFVRRWEMAPYLKMAKRYGAKLEVIECTENFGNIHGVEPETIEKMKKRWQEWQSVPQ